MGASRKIITDVLYSLKTYINDPTILFEPYRANPGDLEAGRQDIRRARVGLYEQTESVTDRVDPRYANLSSVSYGIDISLRRAYINDDASRGELPLLDIKDMIIDWAGQVDAGLETDTRIYTFGYDGSGTISRNDIFVTITLNFTAIKDLTNTQS
jgi:hypothetical protein